MSAELAQMVTALAEDGLQVNLWPTDKGYQANVKERAAKGWTIASDPDPVTALLKALRMRCARILPERMRSTAMRSMLWSPCVLPWATTLRVCRRTTMR